MRASGGVHVNRPYHVLSCSFADYEVWKSRADVIRYNGCRFLIRFSPTSAGKFDQDIIVVWTAVCIKILKYLSLFGFTLHLTFHTISIPLNWSARTVKSWTSVNNNPVKCLYASVTIRVQIQSLFKERIFTFSGRFRRHLVPSVPRLGGREDDVTVLTFNYYFVNLASNTSIPTFKIIKAIENYCTGKNVIISLHLSIKFVVYFWNE